MPVERNGHLCLFDIFEFRIISLIGQSDLKAASCSVDHPADPNPDASESPGSRRTDRADVMTKRLKPWTVASRVDDSACEGDQRAACAPATLCIPALALRAFTGQGQSGGTPLGRPIATFRVVRHGRHFFKGVKQIMLFGSQQAHSGATTSDAMVTRSFTRPHLTLSRRRQIPLIVTMP